MTIHGVPVRGTRLDILHLADEEQIDEVIIAMPTAPGRAIREIVAICQEAGVACKTMPGIYELISGRVSVRQVREVRIEDLLRREPVRIDGTEAGRYLSNAVVLVTGAGGSIGSELCRQIASYYPGQLLLLGHGENSIYHILLELQERFPRLVIQPLIADIRDYERLAALFARYKPDVIFHAAAHKHVPLMEENVAEAVMNNVFGTRNLLQAYEAGGVGSRGTPLAVNYLKLADAKMQVGGGDVAIELWRKAATVNPDNLYALYRLARIHRDMRDEECALEYERQLRYFDLNAVAISPDARMAGYQARAMAGLVEDGVWEWDMLLDVVSYQVEQFTGEVQGLMTKRELRTLLESWPEDATIAGCLDKRDPVTLLCPECI